MNLYIYIYLLYTDDSDSPSTDFKLKKIILTRPKLASALSSASTGDVGRKVSKLIRNKYTINSFINSNVQKQI